MMVDPRPLTGPAPTVLAVHPGAELFGSDRMFAESVEGFRGDGARVVAILPEEGALAVQLRDTGAEVLIEDTLVLRKSLLAPRAWPTLIRDTWRGWRNASGAIRRVRPDVVYVSTITMPLWPLAARRHRVRSVTHVHEAEHSGRRIVNVALYAPHLAASQLIVNSRFSLQTIESSIRRLTQRAHVVYNGVAGPSTVQEPPRSLSDPLRICYVGRLSPRKGPDLILDAVAGLAREDGRYRVDMVGTAFRGYEWYEHDLAAAAGRLPDEVDVRFHGFQPDIWPFLADADVLIVPSRLDEPFGNTAVEGILAHRPVIVSDTSGLREAAGGYDTAMLVTPNDADALADALRSVRARWGELAAGVGDSADLAHRRHAPQTYRDSVSAIVLPPASSLARAVTAEGSPLLSE
jgi:glycosyltransferase involved in cell wall biosynthesis